ncbi:MAG: S41 family peptidase, partial [Bacteroidales bacterium]|nr:S41 family peptidase [Bacteroidales bacterium]
DPENYFYSLLNENDHFSWIVDDYETLVNSFNNIELSSGISPYFIRVSQSEDVAIIVEYVSKGSPAEIAGVKRGDIITDINGTTLNTENYIELFYSENLSLNFADFDGESLVPNDRVVDITAVVIENNPIQHTEIIEYDGKKIGYIAYTGFSAGENDKWVDSLDNVFANLKAEGVRELIMDIRYNPGGRVSVATHIASTVCPVRILGPNTAFVKYEWNQSYQDYFIEEEGEFSENLVVLLEEEAINQNLNLSTIYFLASGHSASASELIIIGLEPYMNVTHIGENTYGKPYGSFTIPDSKNPPRHNWAIQPIVFKYANTAGYTDFVDGLIPDIEIDDDVLRMKPFGDVTDPMLASALLKITGIETGLKKSVQRSYQYELLPDPVRERKNRAEITIPY